MKLADFKNHVFISYAHVDNEPLTEEARGWIETFHKAFAVRLGQVWGRKPKIWRDRKLQGNDEFGNEIIEQLASSAVLISIISPRYVESAWCRKEIESFHRTAEEQGGALVNNKNRIFKILKTHVPMESHPSVVQGSLGYRFYDEESSLEFEMAEKNFKLVFEPLVRSVSELLRQLDGDAQAGSTGVPVYLALASRDSKDRREELRRDLHLQGYEISPEQDALQNGSGFEQEVRSRIAGSELSLHILGGEYDSIVEQQIELARMKTSERRFSQLIWLPRGLKVRDKRQRDLLERLRTDAGLLERAELLEVSLEGLKTRVAELCPAEQTSSEPAQKSASEDSSGPRRARASRRENGAGTEIAQGHEAGESVTPPGRSIYLIFAKRDKKAIPPIRKLLEDRGHRISYLASGKDAAQRHRRNLNDCDAVLIYQGNAKAEWLDVKLEDLRRVSAYDRGAPFVASAVLMAKPQTEAKKHFETAEVEVIRDFENPVCNAETLKPFLESIEVETNGSIR